LTDRAARVTVWLAIICAASIANVGCAGFSFSKNSSGTTTPPTFTIEGTILPNADGSYATVTLSGAASATTLADNFGSYSFTGLAAGSYTVTPTKSGLTFSPLSQSTTVSTANVTGLNFAAADAGVATYSLSGSISPAAGGSGATVMISGLTPGTTTTADSNGNYSFTGLFSGNYTVTPSKSGYSFSPASQGATISTSNVTGVNFTATSTAPPTYSLSGTINPAVGGSGATVTLTGAAQGTTTADSNGNYSFTGLFSGSYTVTPSKGGYSFSPASQGATISTSNVTGVNFTATSTPPPSYSLSGTVSPATGGSGATVTLSGGASAATTADGNGNYSFTGLPSGNYTVTPSKSGYSFTPASQGATISTSNVTGVNFTATSTAPTTYSLSGTISPAAGGSGATATLTGVAQGTTTADGNGNYSFTGLSSGNYTVTPSKSGYSFSPASQGATISTSNVTGVNFTATSTAPTTYSLSGMISPAAGGSGATVTLTGAAHAATTADSGGNFNFSELPSGSYTVTPTKNGYSFSPSSQSASITNTDLTGINFTATQLPSNTINIFPGEDIPTVVANAPAGTTFIIYPGTYHLTRPITPKNNDSLIGETSCAPPASSCPAIISGSRVIGSIATFNGTNYEVKDQTQQNSVFKSGAICTPGWAACNLPEDLWFDGVPLKHLYATSLPAIASGQWWFDYTNNIIYFHDNPAGHLVETSVVPQIALGPANNVTFQYLTIEEFAVPLLEGGFWPSLGELSDQWRQANGLNWIIENCEMWGHHSTPIFVNYGMQVLNNYIHDNGEFGIGGGIDPDNNRVPSGLLVQGNVVSHNNYANVLPDWAAGGIKFGRTYAAVIRDNIISNNEGAGLHFDVSSSSPVIVGNTITGNTDGDGITYEISWDSALIYNNVLKYNGIPSVANTWPGYQINSSNSTGMNAYCNVMEASAVTGEQAWVVNTSNRGYDSYPPGNYYVSTNNNVHHNTVIWDTGAVGTAGFLQNDPQNQPNFFANNPAPDFNSYHLASVSTANFQYDNNNSQQNSRDTFAQYQAAGADVHGTVDTVYSSGFPTVALTSPADNSSFTNSLNIEATASDDSGISKVEFYVDWNLQTTVTAPPYSFTWSGANSGAHTVSAMAYSNAGVRACSAATVTAQ
jgi:parallel beta-helix repeat protein